MQEAFLSYIQNQELIINGEKVLVGVSGGVDSVALAHLFKTSGFPFEIAHCNFQLRGGESEGDEEFVVSLAKDLGVECHTRKFNTEDFAKERGISIQMAARELRYGWFYDLSNDLGFPKVALAHHKDDQLETMIFNLTKGTGIAGLSGMQPLSGRIIRPLLFAEKQMIEDYAHARGFPWREDSSNESLKYGRNQIRHEVIPVLKNINPRLLETLDLTLLRMIETESLLNDSLITFLNTSMRKEGEDLYINKSALETSLFPTQALSGILGRLGFTYKQCVNIFESLEGVGKVFYSSTHVVNIDRTDLIISPLDHGEFQSLVTEISNDDQIIELNTGNLKISSVSNTELEIKSSPDMAFLDLNKLQFPLKIRHWAAGDWFIPLGMKGKKKISDLMIDEKIPLNLKSRVLVLESGGNIVWVVGHRIDDRFKVTPATERVWIAEYEKN